MWRESWFAPAFPRPRSQSMARIMETRRLPSSPRSSERTRSSCGPQVFARCAAPVPLDPLATAMCTPSLNPLGVPVRVEANVSQAQLYVDGELLGPVPWEGDLAAGTHQLEVRAAGYGNHVEQIRLQKSPRIRLIQVILSSAAAPANQSKNDKESERSDPLRNTVTHAGAPNPASVATLDFSTGWPWLASVGLRAGFKPFLDVGIYVATFGRLTDFWGSTKAGWRVSRYFSVGGDLRSAVAWVRRAAT